MAVVVSVDSGASCTRSTEGETEPWASVGRLDNCSPRTRADFRRSPAQ
jgi:hypothetical protein